MQMGKMCLHGHGTPIDYQCALAWFQKAAANDGEGQAHVIDEAKRARDQLMQYMAEAQANMEAVGYHE